MLTPVVDDDGAPFWEYAAQGELRIQACADCGELRFPPRPCCPHCRSFATDWRRVTGREGAAVRAAGAGR
ncbi:Zn-ribbon domain-containing OB-fold protein, partial [Streptomyces europaeiscabiei]|uniref:Zn-ribbon domain-containing OB-fold protein n=2 Tax=Streptomyces europaeiscabiei TaxID=146819 RepID=UPI0029AD4817